MAFDFLKIWKRVAGAIALSLLLLVWFYPLAAAGLIFSLWNGESSVAYWCRVMNLPFLASFAIATTCSSFDIFTWFCLAEKTEKIYDDLTRPLYDRLGNLTGQKTIDQKARWIRVTYRFCCKISRLLIPQLKRNEAGPRTTEPTMRHYAFLLIYGFVPTCIWTGIGYSLSFKLHLGVAWLILALGNTAKMACFGYFAVKLPFWTALPVFFFGPIIIRHMIDRMMKDQT
jgi:hypothetical protein